MKIGILGGGLTGLSLGYFLKEKRIDFEILEKEEECGGLCRSHQEQGFTFDCSGGHILWSGNKEILNFMLSLISDNIRENKRNTKIFYKNKFIKYPFENGLADLDPEERFECLFHFIDSIYKKDKKEPENFEDWVYYAFGKAIAEKYMIPYNKKIWKSDLKELGLDWIRIKDRLPQPKLENVLKSALGINSEGYAEQILFYYPKKGGIQSVIKSLENKIDGDVTCNFEIKKLIKNENKWIVSNGTIKKEFDEIISTVPIIDLINLIDDVPKHIKEASKNLKYNSFISVVLGLNVENLNNFHWLYIPDIEVKTHKIIFPKNNTPEVSPKGKSLLVAEIICKFNDDFWSLSDEEIIKEIVEQLDKNKIIEKSIVCFSKVMRTRYAYVVNDLNYQKNLSLIKDFLSKQGIKLCGRFGEWRYMNMDACIEAAKKLSDDYK